MFRAQDCSSYFGKQWAADSTHRAAMMVPPQTWPEVRVWGEVELKCESHMDVTDILVKTEIQFK